MVGLSCLGFSWFWFLSCFAWLVGAWLLAVSFSSWGLPRAPVSNGWKHRPASSTEASVAPMAMRFPGSNDNTPFRNWKH